MDADFETTAATDEGVLKYGEEGTRTYLEAAPKSEDGGFLDADSTATAATTDDVLKYGEEGARTYVEAAPKRPVLAAARA